MIDNKELKELQRFANKIIEKAGKLLLNEQKNAKIVNQKDIVDIATSADLNSESLLIENIQSNYPDHNIISEEAGEIKGKSNLTWYIDPLDGTKEYIRRIPLFNSSILLEFEGVPIVSAIYRPTSNTLYSAAKGLGAKMDKEAISTSKGKDLNESFVYAYPPSYKRHSDHYDQAWEVYKKLNKKVYRLRNIQDENTGLCWLAHGGHEAYLNISNPPKDWHDIGPGYLIAKEAGAVITDIKGDSINHMGFDSIVAASNEKIHKKLMQVINE